MGVAGAVVVAGIVGANAVTLGYLSDIEAAGCGCATRPPAFRVVKGFAIVALVYTTLAAMARLGVGGGVLPSGTSAYTRVLDVTVAAVSLVVHAAALRWVALVSRGDCACSDDARRGFLWAWAAFSIAAVVAAGVLAFRK